MKKLFLFISLVFSLNSAFASNECDSTWNNSSAAQSCGHVCTNPDNVQRYPFITTYNSKTNECTFKAGCCEGLPYQICSYQYAVCDQTTLTVKRDDSNFQNIYGKLKHN